GVRLTVDGHGSDENVIGPRPAGPEGNVAAAREDHHVWYAIAIQVPNQRRRVNHTPGAGRYKGPVAIAEQHRHGARGGVRQHGRGGQVKGAIAIEVVRKQRRGAGGQGHDRRRLELTVAETEEECRATGTRAEGDQVRAPVPWNWPAT